MMKKFLATFLISIFILFLNVGFCGPIGGGPIGQGGNDESNIAITGGTIDGAVIGGTTPAAGSFTTLTASTDPVDADGVGDRGYNDLRYLGIVPSVFKLDHNTEILNADRTILFTDKPILWFDSNGADRNVILPAEASSTDLVFTIYNDSDGAGEDLVIRNDTPTTLITIGPGQGAEISCDGTSWRVLNNKGIYYDIIAGQATCPNGSVVAGNAPGFAFSSYPDSGIAANEANLGLWESGTLVLNLADVIKEFRVPADFSFAFSSQNDNNGGSDTSFYRGAAGLLKTKSNFELQKESADAEETISVYHDTEATAPIITLRKADNTAAAPALVDDNAVLGRINFKGYDGSGWHTGAKIEARIDGTPSDGTDMPTELVFATTPDGSGSPVERIVIQPDGGVDIINRFSVGVMTFAFTTEGDITDPLTGSVVLLDGDNDGESDTIDLQDGTTAGQVLCLIAAVEIDVNDTCTINYGDTTCTNCPATVFDKVGENAHLIWTGSTWVVISLQDAL